MGLIGNIREEIRIIRERDPAIHSSLEVFLYPSFKVMLHYRVAHRLYRSGHFFLARWVSQRGARKTGIEIHPGARIGKGFFIDHGNGVKSFYAHCSEVLVTKGQTVAMGETVARVGSSGSATGPHLHLELKYGKMHLDPAYYVEFLEG